MPPRIANEQAAPKPKGTAKGKKKNGNPGSRAAKAIAGPPSGPTSAANDVTSDLQKHVEELQAQLAEQKSLREAAELHAKTSNAVQVKEKTLIPKPPGSAGAGFNLQVEMGLEDNDAQYQAILRIMLQTFPMMRDFVNDWPTAEIIKQYMRNKRKYAVGTGTLEPRNVRMKGMPGANVGGSRKKGGTSNMAMGQSSASGEEENESVEVDRGDRAGEEEHAN
ncbi:hypothetical protein SCP_1003730 [Sparassis crispa]|uniref:Uncharacterized protein n=1 Tax=Sparassis crispa TaxID=139825 RepID=A0A401GY30_9APHY|nr:hypothetical protein SCP_1003730 [Sparassis crispa]GBE87126.1 hypothetical protein SCP_1003730 [Sparassis crispa]